MSKIKNLPVIIFVLSAAALFAVSCKKDAVVGGSASSSPSMDSISPGAAPSNAVLTLTGSGLGAVQSIVFDSGNVVAAFNPVFNTDNAIIFRVPVDAVPAKQNIIFTNSLGKQLVVPFQVLGLPTITDVSNYNFSAQYPEVTLTGKNLDDVSHVAFSSGNDTATIVSKSKTSLVISMPATAITRSYLTITNAGGTITTTQEFVNLDQAVQIFTDNYANGFGSASWSGDNVISTTIFKSGNASVGKPFSKGQWSQFGFGYPNVSDSSFKYLSFWIKGASEDYSLWISTNTSTGGFASFNDYDKITVPANVWTYFKLPVDALKLWDTGTAFNQIGWRIQGPNDQDETFYLDDVIFVK